MQRLFQDALRYDLGRVGRYKLNQKLGLDVSLDTRTITPEDIVEATKLLCQPSVPPTAQERRHRSPRQPPRP